MMGKANVNYPPLNAMLYVYVEDTDKAYKLALEKGAVSVMEPRNQFYGDWIAGVKDRDGIIWLMATHVKDVSAKELLRRNKDN